MEDWIGLERWEKGGWVLLGIKGELGRISMVFFFFFSRELDISIYLTPFTAFLLSFPPPFAPRFFFPLPLALLGDFLSAFDFFHSCP